MQIHNPLVGSVVHPTRSFCAASSVSSSDQAGADRFTPGSTDPSSGSRSSLRTLGQVGEWMFGAGIACSAALGIGWVLAMLGSSAQSIITGNAPVVGAVTALMVGTAAGGALAMAGVGTVTLANHLGCSPPAEIG